MQKWEYRTHKFETAGLGGEIKDLGGMGEMLNEAGQEGWELVTVIDTTEHMGHRRQLHFTFKRPLSGTSAG